MRACRFHKPERVSDWETICYLYRPYLSCEQALLQLTGKRGRERKSSPVELAALYLPGPQSSLFGSHAENVTRQAWSNRARGVMGRSKKGSVFPHSFFLSLLALPLTTLLSLIRTLRCGDGDGNENVKSNRFNRQNNMSTRASDFLYIFLPSLHDNDMKISNFKFSGGRKQATSKFFVLWTWIWFLWIKSPGKFAYIWVGIIAMNEKNSLFKRRFRAVVAVL